MKPFLDQLADLEQGVFVEVNRQRTMVGAGVLQWDGRIADAARTQSLRMMIGAFFSHVDPLLGPLGERVNRAGVAWIRCAENLFTERRYDDPVAIAIVEWMHSPGHKQNLLENVYTRTGVGVAMAEDERLFMTQIFVLPPPAVTKHLKPIRKLR